MQHPHMAPGNLDKARPSLPPELVQMVRSVQKRYPELCEQNLSAFTSTAVRRHILWIRRQGALEELARAGLEGKLPGDTTGLSVDREIED